MISKKYIVESQPDIIGNNPLFIVFPTRTFPQKHIAQFIEFLESGEVFESFDMIGIISVYLIKKQVTVLKATRMDRDEECPFPIPVIMFTDEAQSISNARNNNVSSFHKILYRVYDLKSNIVLFKPFDKPICLVLVLKNPKMRNVWCCFNNTKGCSTRGIS